MTVETFRRSPLRGREERLETIAAREVAFLEQVSVRTGEPRALGLPTTANTWTTLDGSPEREALWLGPDEWLVVGGPAAPRGRPRFDVHGPIADGLEGADALVDVSANRAVIELTGTAEREPRSILEQGCSLDLEPPAWRAGVCAQTLLAHVPVLLQVREDATRIFVRPSFSGWLLDWLLAAAGG